MEEWTKLYHKAMRYLNGELAKETETSIEAPSENGEPLVAGSRLDLQEGALDF